jgi:hypothetical protein
MASCDTVMNFWGQFKSCCCLYQETWAVRIRPDCYFSLLRSHPHRHTPILVFIVTQITRTCRHPTLSEKGIRAQ